MKIVHVVLDIMAGWVEMRWWVAGAALHCRQLSAPGELQVGHLGRGDGAQKRQAVEVITDAIEQALTAAEKSTLWLGPAM